MLAACGAAAGAVLLDDGRARRVAMCAALVIAPVLVLGNVWDEPRVVDFRDSPLQLGLAVIVGGALLALVAAGFRRHPGALGVAAFAVLPLRVPIEIGGETANLLVPLYVVIAAGVLARLSAPVRGDRAGREAWPRWLEYTLAATLVLYAIQGVYSEDVSNAIENIGFFLVPFAVMLALLTEVEWSREVLGRVLIAVGAVAACSALVALYQWLARDLFLNPELFDANELHVYFRVNSVFFDPNILGRYLALAITALAAFVAWNEDRRRLAIAIAVCALMLAGLTVSYSITSFAALLAGLGMVALLRWGLRGALAVGALGLVGLVALLIAGGTPNSDIQSDRGIDSGRESLISGGLELAGDRPLGGYGSGSFGAAFYEQIEAARTTVSHSEPITVAAEQGVIGLVVYAAFVVTALVTLLGAGARDSLARAAVAACFVAMLVHSLGYAGFAIDPATWALVGLGLALRARPPGPPDPSATI